jgi:hypothetical protein
MLLTKIQILLFAPFFEFILGFSGVIHYSGNDVPVDNEAPVATSRISRFAGAQSFEGVHRGRVCVRVFIGVSVRACCKRLHCTVSISKKKKMRSI